MIDMAVSFWLQVLIGVTLGPLIIFGFGRMLRPGLSIPLAYGLGAVIAGGLLAVISLILLSNTSSGGRGWGGLIFIFVLGAHGILAGLGGLSMLLGLLLKILPKEEGKQAGSPPDALR